jgi:hypothetical protein
MLRRSFLPFSSDIESELRSDFTNLNPGAMLPLDGRFPDVFAGIPLSVILAINFFSKLVKLFYNKVTPDQIVMFISEGLTLVPSERAHPLSVNPRRFAAPPKVKTPAATRHPLKGV